MSWWPYWISRNETGSLFAIHFSPGGVYKADVVEFGPASKNLFFSDEAMVISTAAPLVLQVRYTLIWPSGFIVVIWHSFRLRMPPIPQRSQLLSCNIP